MNQAGSGRSRPARRTRRGDPDLGQHDQVSGVLSRIRLRSGDLFPAERQVAKVILDRPHRVVYMSIAELAGLASVSEGTVVRFCKTVGWQGYQALKLALAIELAQHSQAILGDIAPADRNDVLRVAEKVFRADIQALEDTLKVLDGGALQAVVDAISNAGSIELFAVGTSLPTALDIYSRLLRIDLPVHLEQDSHLQIVRASLTNPGDVALAISHTGSSREPVECLEVAKVRGSTTIAITGRSPSPITEHADIVLMTISSETRYREEAMASRSAQLSLLDAVYLSLALRRSERTLEALRTTSEALAVHRI